MELVGREDEFVRPALVLLDSVVRAARHFECTLHRGAHGEHLAALVLGLVHQAAAFGLHKHLFRVHLVLREVLHVGSAEVAQAAVERDEGRVDSLDFHALHHFAGEVQAGGGRGHGAFVAGEDALEALHVFGFALAADEAGDGRLAEVVERFLELVVVAVVEEAERASAARGIVDYLCHDGVVLTEIQLVADADFAGRVYQHVPEAELLVQFAQEEHLDACPRLLLVAVESGGEDLRVVEDKNVVLVEEREDVLEHEVLEVSALAVEHHHARLVAMRSRVLRNLFFGEFEFKL